MVNMTMSFTYAVGTGTPITLIYSLFYYNLRIKTLYSEIIILTTADLNIAYCLMSMTSTSTSLHQKIFLKCFKIKPPEVLSSQLFGFYSIFVTVIDHPLL